MNRKTNRTTRTRKATRVPASRVVPEFPSLETSTAIAPAPTSAAWKRNVRNAVSQWLRTLDRSIGQVLLMLGVEDIDAAFDGEADEVAAHLSRIQEHITQAREVCTPGVPGTVAEYLEDLEWEREAAASRN